MAMGLMIACTAPVIRAGPRERSVRATLRRVEALPLITKRKCRVP